MQVVFWQRMMSPHMMGLAEALAARGTNVTFVATEQLSRERREQGWQVAPVGAVRRRLISDAREAKSFLSGLERDAIHITQGLRGNAEIGTFQHLIAAAGQRLWVVMESVDPGGWRAPLKNIIYAWEIMLKNRTIDGVLAIGAATSEWLIARGFPHEKVHPFAYFIDPAIPNENGQSNFADFPFTFGYVGNLEPWKNPMLALQAFIDINTGPRRLVIAGGGSLTARLVDEARLAPPEAQVQFVGRLKMNEVPSLLAQIDCLILPSNVDGWGVVASEAMLVGTPVIVSDACGVHAVVKAAPDGSVFPARDIVALKSAMAAAQYAGRRGSERVALKEWSTPLGAGFGAEYLEQVLTGSPTTGVPEWLRHNGDEK